MHVLVSMYLDTTGNWRMPVSSPRSEADERRISSVARAMTVSPYYAFSTFTRKALYSGVQVFGSMADGGRRLAGGPVCFFAPAYPQWIAKPISQVACPSSLSDC